MAILRRAQVLGAAMKPIESARRRLAAGVAAAALLAAAVSPSIASAATWVVIGHGFGHGVGMSQYGAYGYALHGKDYRFILGHYYQGTTIGNAPTSSVKVLLTVASSDVTFGKATAACDRTLNPGLSYRAHRSGGSVQLLSSGGRTIANCGGRLRATGHGRVWVRRNGSYRGALVVLPSSGGGGLNVVNAVGVDKYVQGVIAGEMPSSWPIEALKAQAVAARSYALSGTVRGHGFNLYDDTRSQVYNGISGETASTNRAANATKGQVVMYGGQVARTYYSASSGGQTESIQFGFPGAAPLPYLVGVPDPYDTTSPLHTWRKTFSQGQIDARLGALLRGSLKAVQITKTGVSPRIVTANLVGSGGTTRVTGSELESALGGYSTWMTFSNGSGPPPAGGGSGGGGSTGGGPPSG
jgi:stage II sporulation protein D